MRRRLITIAGAVALLCLAAPAAAHADILGIPTPSLNPEEWAVGGFKAIIKFILGDKLNDLGHQLVNLLLAVPILTDTKAFPKLNEYRGYITGGSWGILGLAFVVSSMRYWLSGGTGAYEGLVGFVRTGWAIVIVLAFPRAFDLISRIVNALTAALIDNPIVGSGLSKGMVGTLSTAPLDGGGIAMLIAMAAIVMAIILLVVKVIVTALLAVLFVLSPLAIALWPIEETSWALRDLLAAMGALLVFPILWAVCFGTFAVLNNDALFPGGHGDLLISILSPLIVLAGLIIAFQLPFSFLNRAMGNGLASHGGRAYRAAGTVRTVVRTKAGA